MVYKINEIFYSIQGEGANTGMPAIFIRFAGCNLNCWFCDTDFSENYEYDLNELIEKLEEYNCKNIVLTGGEPTLQVDNELLTKLKIKGYHICLETNGTRPIIEGYDWVTCSPKSDKVLRDLEYVNEIKIVNEPHITDQMLDWYGDKYEEWLLYLQPCDDAKHHMNIDKTVEMVKRHPKWRLSIQTQKLIDIK